MKKKKKLPAFQTAYRGFKYIAVFQKDLYSTNLLFVVTVEKM